MAGRRRPSFYLLGASAALLVSCALSLGSGGNAEEAGPEAELLARGWQWADGVVCEELENGAYYEAETEEYSTELLYLAPGRVLAARLPLPDGPYRCRKIERPLFVEEIL